MNKLVKKTLSNGLEVYFLIDKSKKNYYIEYFSKFGSSVIDYEIDGVSYKNSFGVAHFIEHLLIETSKYGILMNNFRDKGIRSNGYTSLYKTAFHVEGVDQFNYVLYTLVDGISNYNFKKEDLEIVKRPVYEEIRLRKDSVGFARLKVANEKLLDKHYLTHSLGEIEDIKKIEYDEIIRIMDHFYNPSNMQLFIGGNIDIDESIRILESAFEGKEVNKYEVVIKQPEYEKVSKPELTTINFPTFNTNCAVFFRLPLEKKGVDKFKFMFYILYFLYTKCSTNFIENKKLIKDNVIIDDLNYELIEYANYIMIRLSEDSKNSDLFFSKIPYHLKNINKNKRDFELFKRRAFASSIYDSEKLKDDISNYMFFTKNDVDYNKRLEIIESYNFEEYLDTISKLDFSNYTCVKVEDITK